MTREPDVRSWLRRYLTCVAALALSLVALPLSALFAPGWLLPARLRNALFFWPQYLLLPNGFLTAQGGTPVLFRSATPLAIPFWLGAIGLYVWLTRRTRRSTMLLGLVPVIAVVLELGLRAIDACFGLRVMLDGP